MWRPWLSRVVDALPVPVTPRAVLDERTESALRHATGQVSRARRDGRTFARVDTEALAAVLQHVEDLTRGETR